MTSMATSRGNTGRQFEFCSSRSEAPPKLAKLLSCRYVDEFGETKTVTYEAGKPQGFMPQGQHLPVIPRPSSGGGNVDDEFGTDEDWQSVDADQDGIPDPPRPKDQRTTPIVQARPPPPTFIPASQQARPLTPTFIPAQPVRLQPQFQFQPPQQPQRDEQQQFNGPIFPFQFASVPARAPHQLQGGFVPVPFSFQGRQPRE